jgi:chromosome partitioning protein
MIISLAIQKGGSGKTTTAINLAAALQQMGKRCLLVDLDPQANCTQALGIRKEPAYGMYELLHQAASGDVADAKAAILPTESGPDMLPASLQLANSEMELVSIYGRETLLKQVLQPLTHLYDYIFIDCPPAIGILTVNALTASEYVIMPLQAEFLPVIGLRSFLRAFERIKKQLNPKLPSPGIVLTKYDSRKILNRQVLEELEAEFGNTVYSTRIRVNIALAKSQEMGLDIFHYDKNSHAAHDYQSLAEELITKLNHS